MHIVSFSFFYTCRKRHLKVLFAKIMRPVYGFLSQFFMLCFVSFPEKDEIFMNFCPTGLSSSNVFFLQNKLEQSCAQVSA